MRVRRLFSRHNVVPGPWQLDAAVVLAIGVAAALQDAQDGPWWMTLAAIVVGMALVEAGMARAAVKHPGYRYEDVPFWVRLVPALCAGAVGVVSNHVSERASGLPLAALVPIFIIAQRLWWWRESRRLQPTAGHRAS